MQVPVKQFYAAVNSGIKCHQRNTCNPAFLFSSFRGTFQDYSLSFEDLLSCAVYLVNQQFHYYLMLTEQCLVSSLLYNVAVA